MYICEMMAVQKEMRKGFNLQTTQAQRVYTILEIIFELMFIKVSYSKSQRGKKRQTNVFMNVVSWFSSWSTNL